MATELFRLLFSHSMVSTVMVVLVYLLLQNKLKHSRVGYYSLSSSCLLQLSLIYKTQFDWPLFQSQNSIAPSKLKIVQSRLLFFSFVLSERSINKVPNAQSTAFSALLNIPKRFTIAFLGSLLLLCHNFLEFSFLRVEGAIDYL